MLKALLLSLTTALAAMATAQTNLVPNGSFEDTVNCDGQVPYSLRRALHWSSPNMATPDVYDCDLDRICGDPMDPDDLQGVVLQGFQYAYHGLRFAAGFQWYGPGVPPAQDTREYLMVKLAETLEQGRSYAVSLYYSRAEGYRYAIDHIGVYFGPDSVFEAHPVVLGLAPQVALRDPTSPYLIEGDDWVQLVDTFMASGGERWMVIGTFNGSDDVDGIVATPSSSYGYAYYYFDQVEVLPLEGVNSVPDWTVWYSGSGAVQLNWSGSGRLDQVRLYDPSGRLLWDTRPGWTSGGHLLQVPGSMAAGVYLLEVLSGGARSVKRFVKEAGGY